MVGRGLSSGPTKRLSVLTFKGIEMFSNSTEWEIWSHNWCRKCVNDVNEDCPIILDLMLNGTSNKVYRIGTNGYLNSIVCDDFEERNAE